MRIGPWRSRGSACQGMAAAIAAEDDTTATLTAERPIETATEEHRDSRTLCCADNAKGRGGGRPATDWTSASSATLRRARSRTAGRNGRGGGGGGLVEPREVETRRTAPGSYDCVCYLMRGTLRLVCERRWLCDQRPQARVLTTSRRQRADTTLGLGAEVCRAGAGEEVEYTTLQPIDLNARMPTATEGIGRNA
jgi:hypothetical protein